MASDIITPLTRVAFVYNGPKRMELAPNPRYMEVAKALGGSFKLVTPAPKTCKGDDSTAQGNMVQFDVWYGFLLMCYLVGLTLSLKGTVFEILDFEKVVTLKSVSKVIQGHRNRHLSIRYL